MKREGIFKVLFVFIVLSVLSAGIATASVNIANNTIRAKYQAGETIDGKINLSITNEQALTNLTSSFGTGISLIDLLRANAFEEVNDYNCSIKGCVARYLATDEVFSLDLETGIPQLIGFKIPEDTSLDSITSLSFKVTSNMPPLCRAALWVAPLLSEDNIITNYKTTGNVCPGEFTICFDDSLDSNDYTIATIGPAGYCEKMTMGAAPGYQIGARIQNSGGKSAVKLTMELYDLNWNSLKTCRLTNPSQGSDFVKVDCRANYTSVKDGDYFVCISSDSDSSGYKIKSENSGDDCGTTGTNKETLTRDYDIFASPLEFTGADFEVNETNFYYLNGISLNEYVNNYVNEKYENNCTDGCIIPFEIYGEGQSVTLSDAEINYEDLEGTSLSNSALYTIEEENPKITKSRFLNLEISHAGFKAPSLKGLASFKLSIGGKEVLIKTINVTSVESFSLVPNFAYIGANTEFNAIADFNITASSWNFGDASAVVTSSNKKASHRYMQAGDYIIRVELTKKSGEKISKSFDITVGNAMESAQRLIENYEGRINGLPSRISKFPAWLNLGSIINVTDINASLETIKGNYDAAAADEEYSAVVSQLIELNVPYNVSTSKTATLPASAGFENMDVSLAGIIANNSNIAGNEATIKNNIIYWMNKNFDVKVDQEIVSAYSDSGKDDLITRFKIRITKKAGSNVTAAYLVIGVQKDSLIFKESYGEQDVGTGTYIPISGTKDIELAILQTAEISDLSAYITPTDISKFGLVSGEIPEVEKKSPLLWIISGLLILFLIFIVVYLILQEWYRRNYETRLFKNRELLFSMMRFISNSKRSGASDEETRKKLLKAGWNKEQIRYAFRKVEGKSTGLPLEIPLFGSSGEKREEKKSTQTREQQSSGVQ